MKTQPVVHRFEAYHVLPDSPLMQRAFLYVLASLMSRSSGPLATEVVRVARLNGILPVEIQGFQEFPGKGLGGLVQLPDEQRPRAVVLGTREFIAECGLQIPDILEVTARKWRREAGTEILLAGWDAWVRGVIKTSKSNRI